MVAGHILLMFGHFKRYPRFHVLIDDIPLRVFTWRCEAEARLPHDS